MQNIANEIEQLASFVNDSRFRESGAFFTDLDGTALDEERGRIYIPDAVRSGVKNVHDIGRPVVINTLRFPLSVMRTVGLDWYEITNAPIPTVLLNGSVLGHIHRNALGILVYEELGAFPLQEQEVDMILDGVHELISNGIRDLVVFYYPRNWIRGEMIWTPNPDKVREIQEKFVSSTHVFNSGLKELGEEIKRGESCMIFILVNEHRDNLMAYQHSKPSNFFTRGGIDKASGTRAIADMLDISLADSIGAGDTVMDTFLSEVGFSVTVGGAELPHTGRFGRARVANSLDLGRILMSIQPLNKGHLTAV